MKGNFRMDRVDEVDDKRMGGVIKIRHNCQLSRNMYQLVHNTIFFTLLVYLKITKKNAKNIKNILK